MGPDFADDARVVLDARFAAREKGISGSRKVIRSSANGIRALHRGEWDQASGLIGEAGTVLADITTALADHPDILYAGFVSGERIPFWRSGRALLGYLALAGLALVAAIVWAIVRFVRRRRVGRLELPS